MTWDDIQSKFQNVKQDGWDEYQLIATCPAHDDRKPSLSIKLDTDKVLIDCQAGCDTKDVVAAAGLSMADLTLTRTVQEIYEYQDESGKTVQRRLRYIPKDFRWEHMEYGLYDFDTRTRKEEWKSGKGDFGDIAYHLPDLIKAVEDNKLIFITEGEKDADNLLKFYPDCQTTTLGSAIVKDTKRLDALYPLDSYDKIAIIPDNDKAGMENAIVIANRLINWGCKVKIVQIDGVKDISDWIKTGKYTSYDLEELFDRAKYAQPSGDPMGYLRKTYTLLNFGGIPAALNLKELKKGQIVTSKHDSFMVGDGGRTIVSKKKIKNRDGSERIVEIEEKVGPLWWKQELNSGMRIPVFKPGQKEVKPDEFNLWNGWGVEPSEKGSCQLFKDHLLNVVCSGNQDWYKFLWDWFCSIFQNPQDRNGVIVSLQGIQGSGKSFIGEVVLAKLLGPGFCLMADPNILESTFTEYLANTLCLQLDESFFSGSHATKNFLKSITTSPQLKIHQKFLSRFNVDNYLHIFITSNADWIVPVEITDRRNFVLRTTDAYANNRPYFEAIMKQLKEGGYERLLWEFLTTKIATDWSKIPATEVKQEQINYGEPILLWWKDCILYHPVEETVEWKTRNEVGIVTESSPMYPYEGQEVTPTQFYGMFGTWYERTKQRGEFPKSVNVFAAKIQSVLGFKSEAENVYKNEKRTKEKYYKISYEEVSTEYDYSRISR